MSVFSIIKAKTLSRRFGWRLAKDSRGTAAIEFVLLVPLLLVFMMGTLEVSRAINVDKRINAVTAMAGDLISREESLDTTALNGIMGVVTHVMHPYNPADLKMTVIPVMADPNDETKTFVYATPFKYNGGVSGGPSASGECYSFSAGSSVMSKGSTVIVVKAEYNYSPLYQGFFDGFDYLVTKSSDDVTWDNAGQTLTDQSIHSPRMGCVDFDNNNCVVSTPSGC